MRQHHVLRPEHAAEGGAAAHRAAPATSTDAASRRRPLAERDGPASGVGQPEADLPALGCNARHLRKERGFTLQQVADRAGLSKGFVSQVDSGTATPPIASLKKIAHVLNTTLSALLDEGTVTDGTAPRGDEEAAEAAVRVVRKTRRRRLIWPVSQTTVELLTPDQQRTIEVLLGELLAHGT